MSEEDYLSEDDIKQRSQASEYDGSDMDEEQQLEELDNAMNNRFDDEEQEFDDELADEELEEQEFDEELEELAEFDDELADEGLEEQEFDEELEEQEMEEQEFDEELEEIDNIPYEELEELEEIDNIPYEELNNIPYEEQDEQELADIPEDDAYGSEILSVRNYNTRKHDVSRIIHFRRDNNIYKKIVYKNPDRKDKVYLLYKSLPQSAKINAPVINPNNINIQAISLIPMNSTYSEEIKDSLVLMYNDYYSTTTPTEIFIRGIALIETLLHGCEYDDNISPSYNPNINYK